MNWCSKGFSQFVVNVGKGVEELQEKIREQEEVYEEEVRRLKSEIRSMKKKLSENEGIFQDRVNKLHEEYQHKIQVEKHLNENSGGKLKETFKELNRDLKVKQEESIRVFATSTTIKTSLQDEISSLESQKHSFLQILSEIQSKTRNLEQGRAKELKKNLKSLQSSQDHEAEQILSKTSIEKQEVLQLSTQKTDLLHKLQQTLGTLKTEQSQKKSCKYSKLTNLDTLIKSTKSEVKDLKYKTGLVKSQLVNRKITEQDVENKALLLENLHEVNKDLWNRYEKLSKLIF